MRDITLGQYINGDSVIHRLDPRVRLILTLAYIIVLFMFNTLLQMVLALIFILLAYALVKIPAKMLLKSLKPIIPIILFTSVLNMFFIKGDVIFSFWKISVTKQGLYYAAMMSLRVICLIASSSLLTYTSTPIQLTSALESLFSPLSRIGLPVNDLAMMMTIALRFIPTLLEETDKIMAAQKSRGANLDTGNFIQRAKALTPILIPLFVSAFRRADELALAMECRCYNGGEGRTRLNALRIRGLDWIAAAVFTACCVMVFLAGRLPL